MKQIFGGVPLKDANNHSLILSFAYVNTENRDNWSTFLRRFREDFLDVKLIISDRDKGLFE